MILRAHSYFGGGGGDDRGWVIISTGVGVDDDMRMLRHDDIVSPMPKGHGARGPLCFYAQMFSPQKNAAPIRSAIGWLEKTRGKRN